MKPVTWRPLISLYPSEHRISFEIKKINPTSNYDKSLSRNASSFNIKRGNIFPYMMGEASSLTAEVVVLGTGPNGNPLPLLSCPFSCESYGSHFPNPTVQSSEDNGWPGARRWAPKV